MYIYICHTISILTVLFADNVGFQQVQAFHVPCRQMNTIVYLLPDRADKVQPLDGEEMQVWLGKKRKLRNVARLNFS